MPGSPSRLVRCRKTAPMKPLPGSTTAPAWPRRTKQAVAFEVPLDFVSGRVERLLDLAGVVVGAERPHQGDGLRRRERQVEADDIEVVGGHLEAVGVDAGEGLG